jgi:cytoskeletal protein CcmA (bactofilin family)
MTSMHWVLLLTSLCLAAVLISGQTQRKERYLPFPHRVLSQAELHQLEATNPTGAVVIASANGVVLDQGNQTLIVGPSSIVLNTNGTPAVTMLSSGFVGIGTTSPIAMLHVRPGTMQLDGPTSNIAFNDGTSGISYSNDPTGKLPSNGLFMYGATDGALGTTDLAYGGTRPIVSWNSAGKVAINTPLSTATSTLSVGGTMNVSGDVTIAGNLTVPGNVSLTGTLVHTGPTAFTAAVTVPSVTANQLTVTGTTSLAGVLVNGNLSVSNAVTVSGATTLSNTLTVSGATTLSNALTISGATTASSVAVSGSTTTGSLVSTGAFSAASLAVSGSSSVSSLTVSGNTSIGGLLAVSGPMAMTSLGIGTTSAYSINSSQTATVSVNGSIFSNGSYGFYSGTNYNNCIRTSWASNSGYLDYTGMLSFRSNNGSGTMSTVLSCYNGNVGIGITNPSALLQVNVGSVNNSVKQAMGYSGNSAWDNTSVVFSNGSSTTSPGIAFGYSSTGGTISCGQPGTGANDLRLYAGNMWFQPFSSAGTPASSYMMISTAGTVGVGTASPLGALDVYGGTMYIRGSNAGISFRDNVAPYSGSSYYVNGYMNSGSTYYDMGGMKIMENSGSAGSAYKTDLVFYNNYNSGIYESMRISGSGELQLPASTGYGHIRFVQSTYGSFFKNNGTETYLFLTASGNPYGTYNSLRPFHVNHSTGLLTSENGQVFSGGTTISNGLTVSGGLTVTNPMTANNGLTVSGGATITNGLTVTGGATITGNLTANNGMTVSGGATISGTILTSSYWSINLYGTSIYKNSSGTSFNSSGVQPTTITSGQYAYTTPKWVGSSVIGSSPISNTASTNSYYLPLYSGIYSISFTVQTTGTSTFETFISYSPTAVSAAYDPLNSGSNYVLACSQTNQQETTVSWTGYLTAGWYVFMGVYVNSGTFLPANRTGITMTLIQRSA